MVDNSYSYSYSMSYSFSFGDYDNADKDPTDRKTDNNSDGGPYDDTGGFIENNLEPGPDDSNSHDETNSNTNHETTSLVQEGDAVITPDKDFNENEGHGIAQSDMASDIDGTNLSSTQDVVPNDSSSKSGMTPPEVTSDASHGGLSSGAMIALITGLIIGLAFVLLVAVRKVGMLGYHGESSSSMSVPITDGEAV